MLPTDHPFLSPPSAGQAPTAPRPRAPGRPPAADEWAVLSPFLHRRSAGPGRPLGDRRKALDTVFRLAAAKSRRVPPPEFGKPDTASRRFRRWAEAGPWSRLLRSPAVFLPDPDLSEYGKSRFHPVPGILRDGGVRTATSRPDFLRVRGRLVRAAGGRPRIPRRAERA